MSDKSSENRLFPCIITSACLFPLFFFLTVFMTCGIGIFILIFIVNIIAGFVALFTIFSLWERNKAPKRLWFWLLMILSLPGIPVAFLLDRLIPYASALMIPFFLIQVFFPAIHIVMEARKRKSLWRYILVCIYIFSLTMGCTILFLGRECLFEFFPLAALTGILLECSFIRKQKKIEK